MVTKKDNFMFYLKNRIETCNKAQIMDPNELLLRFGVIKVSLFFPAIAETMLDH